jgi:aminoglycoside 6'-N-acetyltransferase
MGDEVIVSRGEYTIRRMNGEQGDFACMAGWLSDPRVLEFYEGRDRPFSLEMVRSSFDPVELDEDGVIATILEYQGQPAGYLQFYPTDGEEYQFTGMGTVYGLDLFIGEPELWGRGIGTAFVRLLLEYLFAVKNADWVILDPHIDNPRAIRAYEKSGFHRIKLLPRHEWHEGSYVDSWLMGVKKPDSG